MDKQTFTGSAQQVVERYEEEQRRWNGRWAQLPEQLPGESGTEWCERLTLIRETHQREGAQYRIDNHPELYTRKTHD
jgi:hypothetical protein